jgi:MFS family permease
VLFAALAFSAVSTVVFIVAPGVGWLFVARVPSGISTGLVTGTATAALPETYSGSSSRYASMVATAANMAGGLGPLIAGLFAQFGPDPTVLVFEVYLALLAVAAIGLVFVPETVGDRQKLSLRFTGLGIPPASRSEFIAAGVAGFAAFSLLGLFTALARASSAMSYTRPATPSAARWCSPSSAWRPQPSFCSPASPAGPSCSSGSRCSWPAWPSSSPHCPRRRWHCS